MEGLPPSRTKLLLGCTTCIPSDGVYPPGATPRFSIQLYHQAPTNWQANVCFKFSWPAPPGALLKVGAPLELRESEVGDFTWLPGIVSETLGPPYEDQSRESCSRRLWLSEPTFCVYIYAYISYVYICIHMFIEYLHVYIRMYMVFIWSNISMYLPTCCPKRTLRFEAHRRTSVHGLSLNPELTAARSGQHVGK